MDKLSKSNNELQPITNPIVRVVTDEKYGDEIGYEYYWLVKTMGGKTYKVNKEQAELLNKAINSSIRSVEIDNDYVVIHQITGIELVKNHFGPRAGEA